MSESQPGWPETARHLVKCPRSKGLKDWRRGSWCDQTPRRVPMSPRTAQSHEHAIRCVSNKENEQRTIKVFKKGKGLSNGHFRDQQLA